MRKRMSWDWVGSYPVFVYTTYLAPSVFNVDIIIGKKGDQNADGHGPKDKVDRSYTQQGLPSKDQVVEKALEVAEYLIEKRLKDEYFKSIWPIGTNYEGDG